MRVLVIEDDPGIRAPLVRGLRAAGYAVDEAARAEEAESLAQIFPFDLMVVDVGLPEGEDAGWELVRRLRANKMQTPVLFLTARATLEDRIKGLDVGGDDYLVKPFHQSELLARLRALLRRSQLSNQMALETNGLRIDFTAHAVTYQHANVALSAKEYAVLETLSAHPGRIFSREEIIDRVWAGDFDAITNVVDVYVKNIRKKTAPWVIETVRNMGYRFPPPGPQ